MKDWMLCLIRELAIALTTLNGWMSRELDALLFTSTTFF